MPLNPSEEVSPKESVWVSGFPFEKEEGNLVYFGAHVSDAHYRDGVEEVESHLSFNKALWEIAGKPKQIAVAWSVNENFLWPAKIEEVWVVKYSNYEPAEVNSIHLTEESAQKRCDEINQKADDELKASGNWEVTKWKVFDEEGK